MTRPVRSVPRPAFIVGAAVLLAVVLAAGMLVSAGLGKVSVTSPTPSGPVTSGFVSIPAKGGVTLSAAVIPPKGKGPFPLVVMPASWGAGPTEYTGAGEKLAAHGYLVVSYGQRGFGGSGGAVDFAADTTQQDVSTVIDWALAHTPADPKRIAAVGVSYGAGISLLAAARDKRIRAVVAMSGWTSMAGAIAPNKTPNLEAMHLLFGRKGSYTSQIAQVGTELASNPQSVDNLVAGLSPERSADQEIAALNRNKPAIMLANAFEDSVLSPATVVPFFSKLTTPKRLQLAPGDHAGPEHAGLKGEPDATFDDATKWLDHYLRGADNGIDKADPVQLEDGVTGAWHGYRAWPSKLFTAQLGAPNTPNDVTSHASTWQHSLTTGTDTTAISGAVSTLASTQFRAPRLIISSVSPKNAFVWTGATIPRATVVSGTPTVHVGLSASSHAATLFAYLYDVDAAGTATLMTYAPDTVLSAAGTASFSLRPVSWTVAAGHHVVLVIDTVDARYQSAAPPGSTLTLSSTAASPATLGIPLG